MSASLATGSMSPALLNFDVTFVAVTAVINFIVLWYTWDSDPIKIGVTGVVADLMTGTAMVICIGSANLLENGSFAPDMVTLSRSYTFVASAALFIVVMALLRLMDPVVKWFRSAELPHRGLIAAFIIAAVAMFSSTNLTDTAGFDSSSYIVCLVGVLFLVPLILYVVKVIGFQRNRRVLLRQQAEMSSAYILAVENQADSIAYYRQILDAVTEHIEASGNNLSNEAFRTYIKELKARADTLKSGAYSSNIAVDAVLSAFSARFGALGCQTDFRTDFIDEEDMRPAEISGILLNWAQSREEAVSDTRKSSSGKNNSDMIRYRILRKGNQYIYSLVLTGDACSGRAEFPERLLRGYQGRTDVISQRRRNGAFKLKAMMDAGISRDDNRGEDA